MKLIANNPYRILGLPITATEKEIAKQINTLSTYAEMGKLKSPENDYPFLDPLELTSSLIEEAKKQIEQDESKFLHSLFWFWKNNSADELALEVLREGNVAKAIDIWEKLAFKNCHKLYDEELLYKNLIKQSKLWSEQKNEDHQLTRIEEEYVIERIKETSYSVPTVITKLSTVDNWIIECNSEWIAGVDNIGYGIVLGRDNSSFYSFEISANGYFSFSKYEDWKFSKILDWEKSNVINQKSTNHFSIRKTDSLLSFIINGALVKSIEAETFFGNSFGFKVSHNQKVIFNNFRVSKLVENKSYGEGINVTSKNCSSVKNLSTLYLSLAALRDKFDADKFNKGITLARYFFSADSLVGYTKLVAGEKYLMNKDRAFNFFLTDIIEALKIFLDKSEGISTGQFLRAFSKFPSEAKQFLNSKFVAKQVQNIDNEIEYSESQRKNSPLTATKTGKELVQKTKTDLVFLKDVLGVTDFQYQIIADKLSHEIFQCGIDSFNACKDGKGDIDYPRAIESEELYFETYKYAYQIAMTESIRAKAKENLDTCKQFIKDKQYYYCWFCGVGQPDEKSNYEVTIYKETSRNSAGVKFQYLPFKIPRCPKCRGFHLYTFNFEPVDVDTIGFGLVGMLFGLVLNIVSFILGNAFSFIAKTLLIMMDKSKAKIKLTGRSSIKHFPSLLEMLKDGWKFSKPKA